MKRSDGNYQVMARVKNTGALEQWSHPVLARADAVRLMRQFEKRQPDYEFFILAR